MKASALYDSPFRNLHTGGPDALFAGREPVIDEIFDSLEALHSRLVGWAN